MTKKFDTAHIERVFGETELDADTDAEAVAAE
jgi:hypothetical protein